MLRQSITRSILPARAAFFSTTTRAMAGGDTGAARSGGVAAGDAFTKREKANEDYSIKMREKEKLRELRQRIDEQHDSLKKLQEHLDTIEKENGKDEKK